MFRVLARVLLSRRRVRRQRDTARVRVGRGVRRGRGGHEQLFRRRVRRRTVRDAVELYRARFGSYPQPADSDGLHVMLNPYLRGTTFPRVTVGNKNSNAVALHSGDTPTVTAGSEGWVYSKSSGELIINSQSPLSSNASITYDQL